MCLKTQLVPCPSRAEQTTGSTGGGDSVVLDNLEVQFQMLNPTGFVTYP